MNEPMVLKKPEPPWVDRLRRGNIIWLVKEQRYTRVGFPWHAPDPGCRLGQMAVDHILDNYYLGTYTWYIGLDGEGLDGKQLILPCEGELPENPEPLPELEHQQIYRTMSVMRRRMDAMELELMQCKLVLGLI